MLDMIPFLYKEYELSLASSELGPLDAEGNLWKSSEDLFIESRILGILDIWAIPKENDPCHQK